MSSHLNKAIKSKMLKVKDVSEMFQKSPSWVYKNWKQLGGVKCAGSLMFPRENDLYTNIFQNMGTISNPICPQQKTQIINSNTKKVKIRNSKHIAKYKSTHQNRHNLNY